MFYFNKKCYFISVLYIGSIIFACSNNNVLLPEITISNPATINELKEIIKTASAENKKICIVGSGKSQGGQTLCSGPHAYRISLHKLNKLITLHTDKKEVTVQAGMTWKELQQHIAPHKLAVKAMQSFNDFSIGGSLSVNVHGQDIHNGQLIQTVKSFKLLLPNGNIVPVSHTENSELFSLVIGGYGLFGIIIEVTLNLTDDILLERTTKVIKTHQLADYILNHVKNNPSIQFYSARFSMGSSNLLKKALIVTYEKTNKQNDHYFVLEDNAPGSWIRHILLQNSFNIMSHCTLTKDLRFYIEKWYFKQKKIISRNNFMSFSIDSLPHDDNETQYILQEYFIPYEQLNHFIEYLRTIIKSYNINILNVTARHINKNTESKLSFSNQECCALVLYLPMKKTNDAYTKTIEWTRKLIDKVLELKGTYYLPYHLIATQEQLEQAYPAFKEFVNLKKHYDPQEILVNMLYEHYA